MAIRASAGTVTLTLTNANREGANPPVKFLDVNDILVPVPPSCYSFFVKATSHIPAQVLAHNGTDGSFIQIYQAEGMWYIGPRFVDIHFGSQPITPVVLGVWTQFVVVLYENIIDIYTGNENGNNPITLSLKFHQAFALRIPFANFQITVHNHISVCNFKYWNMLPSIAELQDQVNRWDADGAGNPPMWSSTLRTPGDISSIANPYTSTNWAAGHGFSAIDQPDNLVFDATDPFFIANNRVCPTWVYPIIPTAQVTSIPGGGIVKGTPFFQFHDRGSVPLTLPAQQIRYYGLPQGSQTDSYGLYRNEQGIEQAALGQRFEVNTGIDLPVEVQASNMYDWVYSAQFNNPTSGGVLSFLYLFVKYTGYPTGVGIPHTPGTPPKPPDPPVDPPIDPGPGIPPIPPPQPIPVKMSGLFVIDPNALNIDNYDPEIRLKIPNPTIRTAFIGE